jgi:serine/threonine protein phosphatase PrpC
MADIEITHQEAARLTRPSSVLSLAYSTEAGPARQRNEDACSLPPAGADELQLGCLLAVADGVGGLPGGSQASREAVDYLQALYYADSGPQHPADRLSACFEMVNAINRQARKHPGVQEGHLTTLVAAVVLHNQIWVANVGDSRAYLVRAEDGQRHQLTEDHSERNRWEKSGLTNGLRLNGYASGGITRAIGLEEHCQVDTYQYSWVPGDRLVLCSDGLACLTPEEMAELAGGEPVARAADELVARAVEKDGSDNCTVIVAAWGDPSLDEAAVARPGGNGSGMNTDAFRSSIRLLPDSSADGFAEFEEPQASGSESETYQEENTPSLAGHFVEPDTQKRPQTLPQLPGTAPRWRTFLSARDVFFILAGLLLGWVIAILVAFLLISL